MRGKGAREKHRCSAVDTARTPLKMGRRPQCCGELLRDCNTTTTAPPMPPSIVLVQPRIPQNVGSIGRICAATRASLHVVRPIPFELSDRSLKRAGMDYLTLLDLQVHASWEEFKATAGARQLWFLTSHATCSIYDADFRADDLLVFGSESAGLPEAVRSEIAGCGLRIPMPESRARCLNLATSAAIALYEVMRKTGQL